MKLSLGFSPCPNDTFIFDALVHKKIDTEGLEFELVLADVEELNQMAFSQMLDITKLSYHALLYLQNDYLILDAGSALGFGVGPLLISLSDIPEIEMTDKVIAIPGNYTTANLLLTLAYPDAVKKKLMLFSDIESAVLDRSVDAGVIIHENRFTYHQKGLICLSDLGAFWEQLTSFPIPLGGIAVKRNLPVEVAAKFQRVLKRSIEFALTNNQLSEFVKCNAQEMEEEIMRKHISLYVNQHTLSLGNEGKSAILALFEMALSMQLIGQINKNLFLDA